MAKFTVCQYRVRDVLLSAGVIALAALAAGCGGKTQKFNPVNGRVLQGNNPLTGGTVKFTNPADPNLVASSPIASDGSFSLKTSTTDPPRTSPGAPEGTYQVIVNMPPSAPNRPFPSLTAPENYTVVEGENDITVRLP